MVRKPINILIIFTAVLLLGGVRGIRLILVLIFLYIYVQLVLGFFPLTRPIAGQVFAYVLSPLKTIGRSTGKYSGYFDIIYAGGRLRDGDRCSCRSFSINAIAGFRR